MKIQRQLSVECSPFFESWHFAGPKARLIEVVCNIHISFYAVQLGPVDLEYFGEIKGQVSATDSLFRKVLYSWCRKRFNFLNELPQLNSYIPEATRWRPSLLGTRSYYPPIDAPDSWVGFCIALHAAVLSSSMSSRPPESHVTTSSTQVVF